MADDPQAPNVTTPSDSSEPAATTPDPAPRVYSQAEVDAIVQRTKGETWGQARQELRKDVTRQNGESTKKATSKEKGEADADPFRLMQEQNDVLDDLFADHPLGKEQQRAIRSRMRRDNPQDPAAWVSELKTLMGDLPNPATPTPTAPSASAPRTPDPGAPSALPPWERPTDPFKWTAEDVARMEAQMGRRKAHHLIREKAEQYAKTLTLEVPRRR